MLPKSIKWRIQLWHGALLAVVVAGLSLVFYEYTRRRLLLETDLRLQSYALPMLPRINRPADRPPRPPGPGEPRRPAPAEDIYYLAWLPRGERMRSPNAPDDLSEPLRSSARTASFYRIRGGFRELIHHLPGGETALFGCPLDGMHSLLANLAWGLTGGGLVVVGLGFAGGWWFTRRALRPIAAISDAAERIAGGDRGRRIEEPDTESELGRLAAVLNRTFDGLDAAFERQVRFTADASHELRTPLAVVLTQSESALARQRSPEEYRAALEACQRAGTRMTRLVNDLLTLARVDSGEAGLNRGKHDLAEIAREAVGFIAPLAAKRRADVQLEVETAVAAVDAGQIGQVLVNLLTNALQHNPEGVGIRVSVAQVGTRALIQVADSGPGIPAEVLPLIFDRFYRADAARGRATGGSGLGLAIARTLIEAHGGTITAQSKPGEGSVFLIDLPLASAGAL